MLRTLKYFLLDESGAVTVDWVVLTAAIVGLGVSVITVIGKSATDRSDGLGAHLETRVITTSY